MLNMYNYCYVTGKCKSTEVNLWLSHNQMYTHNAFKQRNLVCFQIDIRPYLESFLDNIYKELTWSQVVILSENLEKICIQLW